MGNRAKGAYRSTSGTPPSGRSGTLGLPARTRGERRKPAQACVGAVPAEEAGWAYNLIHRAASSVPLITEHSAGQNGTGQPSAVRSNADTASLQVGRPNGFDWRDAGIGAAGALGLVLLVGGAMLSVRKRRALAHAHV